MGIERGARKPFYGDELPAGCRDAGRTGISGGVGGKPAQSGPLASSLSEAEFMQ